MKPNAIAKMQTSTTSNRRVDFLAADGRVLYAVTVSDDNTGLLVRSVEPSFAGSRLAVFPEASNAVTLKEVQ